MKHLKLFENFESKEKEDFISIIKDKFLELTDSGFLVEIEDEESEPLLEDMIRIIIEKGGYTNIFKFSEVSDILSDVILTNIEVNNLYKKIQVVVIPEWRENHQGERLSYKISGNECQWSFENPKINKMKSLNPLNLNIKSVVLYLFE